MSDTAGLKIIVGADLSAAIANISKFTDETLVSLEKELNSIGRAIDAAISRGADTSKLEDSFQKVSNKIKALKAEIAKPIPPMPPAPPIPVPDDKPLLNSLTKQRIAFLDVGRIVTGQGFTLRSLGSNFALLGPQVTIAAAALYGLYEILTKQTDAEKKAEEQAKKLAETLLNLKSASEVTETSTGSEAGNIARVQALAAAIQDTNKTYKERQNALNELRETNKAYFGDLTLEASSLATLAGRVREYSHALITEAVVKGQVEEIAKVSSELEKQAHTLDILKDARDRANLEAAKPQASSAGNVAGGGADVLNNQAARAASSAADAYNKQRDAVLQLRTAIATYTGELDKNIALQIQQKPLQAPPGYKDELKSIIPILEQIKRIYDELAKPNKEPIFKLFADSTNVSDITLIQTQIREAIKKGATDGANDPQVRKAYDDLATALRAKLNALQNPNLATHIQGIVDVKQEDVDAVQSKIEKAFGGSKGLQIKVPATFKLSLDEAGYSKAEQQILLRRAEEDAIKGLKPIVWNPKIQVQINKQIIAEETLRQLNETVSKIIQGIAASELSQIGIAIGDALSGGGSGLKKALKGFGTILGDGLIAVGKELITASTIIKGLKVALDKLFENPVAGIVVGIAAVAAGEILKNEVNKTGSRAFATGGIVTGPTQALIGEAGPEVVFPLNQLNRFVKNTQGSPAQNINITGQLSGNNIRLVLARANKNQGLV